MSAPRITLAAGLALVAFALGAVAFKHPDTLARANAAKPAGSLASITSRARVCQARQLVPRGTTAVVAWLGAFSGPSVTASVEAGGRVIAHGRRGSGWTSRSVTIPLSRAVPSTTVAEVCFVLVPRYEAVLPRGDVLRHLPHTTLNGRALPGSMTVEYLRRGSGTWLSRLPGIARHMALGRVPSGDWAPILALLLVIAIAGTVTVALVGRPQ